MGYDKENLLNYEIIQNLKELDTEDSNFLSELIKIYLTESKKLLDKIEKGMDSGDKDAIANNTHTLKGSSSNIGAMELSRLCAEIEKKARAGDLEGVKILLPEMKECYELTTEKIKELH
ncbi:MAG: Hpt domain-containing protein [Ignavibacteria bacterium]|nr:Hpt domain-containing protein [Ignavibacteria bacterium]